MRHDETTEGFTPEEEREFTLFNACAFDLERMQAKARGVTTTCWLVTSAEARERSRQALFKDLRSKVPEFRAAADEHIEAEINQLSGMEHMLILWIAAERKFKQLRAAGSPHAFFATDQVD